MNKVYSGKRILLKINKPLKGLGIFNQEKEWIIKGNCGWGVGTDMKGGEIIVEGNTKGWAGLSMKGGKIYIKGRYKILSNAIYGGNIYIWEKDKWKQIF